MLHYFAFTIQLDLLRVFNVKVKNLAFDTSNIITNAWFFYEELVCICARFFPEKCEPPKLLSVGKMAAYWAFSLMKGNYLPKRFECTSDAIFTLYILPNLTGIWLHPELSFLHSLNHANACFKLIRYHLNAKRSPIRK